MNNNNNPRQRGPVAGGSNNNIPKQAMWFSGAPTTKLLTVLSVVLFVFWRNQNQQQHRDDSISSQGGGWGWSNKLTFSQSNGEMVEGTALMVFLYRKYEREMGSRRFCAFWLYVNLLTTVVFELFLFPFVLETYLRVYDITQKQQMYTYTGPYPMLGALFALFHMTSPRVHPRFLSLLGSWQFSEKSFYYLWFFHLLFSSSSRLSSTIFAAIAGALTAWLYWKIPFIQEYVDIPNILVRIIQPILDRIGLSESQPPTHVLAAAQQQHAPAAPRRGPVAPQPQQQNMQQEQMPPMPEPDPDAIEQLTSMGFPRPQVMDALRQTHNNVEHAANRLLTASTSTTTTDG